jgi:hypothetical protein
MRTPPKSTVSCYDVQGCQERSYARHQSHLAGLARCGQPLVESLDAGVVTRANQRGGGALQTIGDFEDYRGKAQVFELAEELAEPIPTGRNDRGLSRREGGLVQVADASSGTWAQPEVSRSAVVMAVTMAARASPRRCWRGRCRCAPKPRYEFFLGIWEGSPGRIKPLKVSPLRAGGKRKSMPTYVCSLNWTEVGIRNVGDTLDRAKAS